MWRLLDLGWVLEVRIVAALLVIKCLIGLLGLTFVAEMSNIGSLLKPFRTHGCGHVRLGTHTVIALVIYVALHSSLGTALAMVFLPLVSQATDFL